ncbi:MAG: hypothetical protein ACOZAM_33030 [Pseudomonadota bacterium]
MTKFSLHGVSLAALGGMAALMVTISAAVPADAATGRSKFQASPEELRRHCWRIDETFWKSKRRYGCGEVVRCAEGSCVKIKIVEPPPPPTPQPPLLTFKREPGKNGDGGNGGARDGGSNNRDGGKKGGGGSSGSAAGGPNGPN